MSINFPFIKSLGLKTVLHLGADVPPKETRNFYTECNVHFVRLTPIPSLILSQIHLGLKAWKPEESWRPVTEELIKEALEKVLDPSFHPIMVTCR